MVLFVLIDPNSIITARKIGKIFGEKHILSWILLEKRIYFSFVKQLNWLKNQSRMAAIHLEFFMYFGAIHWAKISKVVFGLTQPALQTFRGGKPKFCEARHFLPHSHGFAYRNFLKRRKHRRNRKPGIGIIYDFSLFYGEADILMLM